MYALVINDAIQSVGSLPRAARRLDTGQWVLPVDRAWTDVQAASCGYLPVTDTARPADTATTTHDRSVDLVAGVPTVVWTARPKTQAELDAEAESTNETALRDNIAAGISAAISRRLSVQSAAADLAGDLDALGSLNLAAFKALGGRVVALANATAAGMGDTVALARLTVRALDSADVGD